MFSGKCAFTERYYKNSLLSVVLCKYEIYYFSRLLLINNKKNEITENFYDGFGTSSNGLL
jgi:hypothetical protein